MLTEKTIQQAEHISDAVIFAGRSLSAVATSPVNNLLNTLTSLNETGANDQLMQQSIVPGSSAGNHSEVEEYTSKQIARVMANIINCAKNVVNPHCRSIIDGIEERRKDNALASVGLLGTIKQIEIPAILSDEMFQELIEPYQETPAAIIPNTMELFQRLSQDFTPEELTVLIKTGSPLLDSRIDAVIGSMPVLSSSMIDQTDVATLSLTQCITYFLLLTGIQNEKLDKATALMENSSARLLVASLRAAIGGRIYREIAVFDMAISNGEIVVRENFIMEIVPDNCLTVWGVNYRNWIKDQGGSPEAALGYLAERGNRFTIADDMSLRNNPEIYKEIYDLRIAHAKSKNILEDINLVRSFTGNYLADIISRMEDVNRAELQSKLAEALQHEYHGAASLNNYVIKVVSRTLTDGPDVKDILLEIDSILKDSDQPNMEYAVYIASIRLVARWLKDQIVLQVN